MKTVGKKISICLIIILLSTSHSYAKKGNWSVQKDPMGGDIYRLHNSKTGQTTSTTYKDEKKAKKAAKALNKSDKSVRDTNEPGCNEPGVVC